MSSTAHASEEFDTKTGKTVANQRTESLIPSRVLDLDTSLFPKRFRNWSDWSTYLQRRNKTNSIADLFPQRGSWPLSWGLPADVAGSDVTGMIEQLGRLYSKNKRVAATTLTEQMQPWLDESAGRPADPAWGLECLAWAHALPRLGPKADPHLWLEMYQLLLSVAADSAALDVQKHPLTHPLLAGELPFVLAYQFGELKLPPRLMKSARKSLSQGLIELLDGEGLPHAEHLSLLRPLLACWTRSRLIGNAIGEKVMTKEARLQFEWALRQSLRLTRADGTQALESRGSVWDDNLLKLALRLADDEQDWQAYRAIGGRAKHGKVDDLQLPESSALSEWSEVAVLRAGWSRKAAKFTLAYNGGKMVSELESAGRVVWSGPWNPQITVDGRTLSPDDAWEEICWISDEDGDYLELETDLDAEWRLQRQIYFAREDGFLFLSDAVLGMYEAQIEYRSCMPLAGGVCLAPELETVDGHLITGDRRLAVILPLALPEWREMLRDESLMANPEGLDMAVKRRARNLYVPLFIDVNRRGIRRQHTWRQLTVAENRTILTHDVAAAYRVQAGSKQWMFYRALAGTGNRTLLGQNLTSEFIVARFNRSGDTEPLVEIE